MLVEVEPRRNTLPWDIALGFFLSGIASALIVLAIMVWG